MTRVSLPCITNQKPHFYINLNFPFPDEM
jgi:hypothetical protein